MNAVYNKKKEIAEYLIEKGTDVNAKDPNGWSALMLAAMAGEAESVQSLIKAGADVNSKTNDGETPLQRAEKIQNAKLKDMTAIIDILKKAGAK
jgi:ankyrin repeat protein